MNNTKTLISFLAAAFLAIGCQVGGDLGDPSTPDGSNPDGSNPDNPDPTPVEPPDFTFTVLSTPTASLTLGNQADFEFELTSKHGFAGPVTLTAEGVPASWNIQFTPGDTINVPADGVVSGVVSVVIPTTAEALTAQAISLKANGTPGLRDGQVSVDVANQLVMDLAAGTGEGIHPFLAAVDVRVGTTIVFQNSDTTAHRIHGGDGDVGFPHQQGQIAPGSTYEATITGARNGIEFYCHEHGKSAGEGAINALDPAALQ